MHPITRKTARQRLVVRRNRNYQYLTMSVSQPKEAESGMDVKGDVYQRCESEGIVYSVYSVHHNPSLSSQK